jgi:hypothetical protein
MWDSLGPCGLVTASSWTEGFLGVLLDAGVSVDIWLPHLLSPTITHDRDVPPCCLTFWDSGSHLCHKKKKKSERKEGRRPGRGRIRESDLSVDTQPH